ncbi:MAG: hypothetical protein QXX34_02925, partial [Candidatus Bathyarchaeia archaeon]
LQFNNLQYDILLHMEKAIPNTAELTKDTQELTTLLQPYLFKGWQYQQTAKKAVEQGMRGYLTRKYVNKKLLTIAEMDALYAKILDSVKTYA